MPTVVELPPDPKDEHYEDLISAVITAQGYFKESSVTLTSDGLEILEFDALATPTNENWANNIIIEAKSGKWNFTDFFKLFGWKTYTNRPNAILVHKRGAREEVSQFISDLTESTGVKCVHIDPGNYISNSLLPPCREIDELTHKVITLAGRYGALARRVALADLISTDEIDDDWKTRFKTYRKTVNRSIFVPEEARRVLQLYAAWQASPNLPGQAVDYVSEQNGVTKQSVWTDVKTDYKHLWLQYAMAFDHVARLRIMRSAIDIVNGDREMIKEFELLLAPASFIEALNEIQDDEYKHQIPFLFQVFFEVFGGFYDLNSDRDKDAISVITGIPADQIERCLSYYDRFFPFGNSWFYEQQNEICRTKVMPAFMHGIGCLFRQKLYNESNYEVLFPKIGWLLGHWHTTLYKSVAEVLGEREADG